MNMNERELIRISKFFSKHLRHAPERLGLHLASGGWVDVDTLLRAAARHGVTITREELDEVVEKNDKQRFSFDESGTRIRANQGHTTEVDLELSPVAPPAVLYHGTPSQNVGAIRAAGLLKMARHHVHLSVDIETATRVGSRRGRAVVLTIDSAAMHAAGVVFYRSDNGVWLCDTVEPRFIR
jgi:putative RNA 2'-phosphotransferase